jgi:hypothetical protein
MLALAKIGCNDVAYLAWADCADGVGAFGLASEGGTMTMPPMSAAPETKQVANQRLNAGGLKSKLVSFIGRGWS